MGDISKCSIQWEFGTRRALPLKLEVADDVGVRHFFSVLEESSALKSLVHGVVVAEVGLELGLRNR